MADHVAFLTEKVARLKTVGAGLRAVLADVATRLRATAGDAAATRALADELNAEADADAAAIVENTVAAGEPPAPPV